jgi:hypothetical protein
LKVKGEVLTGPIFLMQNEVHHLRITIEQNVGPITVRVNAQPL